MFVGLSCQVLAVLLLLLVYPAGRVVCTGVRRMDVCIHEHAEHETRHKALVLLPVVLL